MFNLISKGTSDARSRAKCRWASAAKAAFYLAQVLLVLPADGRRTFFQQTVAFCAEKTVGDAACGPDDLAANHHRVRGAARVPDDLTANHHRVRGAARVPDDLTANYHRVGGETRPPYVGWKALPSTR